MKQARRSPTAFLHSYLTQRHLPNKIDILPMQLPLVERSLAFANVSVTLPLNLPRLERGKEAEIMLELASCVRYIREQAVSLPTAVGSAVLVCPETHGILSEQVQKITAIYSISECPLAKKPIHQFVIPHQPLLSLHYVATSTSLLPPEAFEYAQQILFPENPTHPQEHAVGQISDSLISKFLSKLDAPPLCGLADAIEAVLLDLDSYDILKTSRDLYRLLMQEPEVCDGFTHRPLKKEDVIAICLPVSSTASESPGNSSKDSNPHLN